MNKQWIVIVFLSIIFGMFLFLQPVLAATENVTSLKNQKENEPAQSSKKTGLEDEQKKQEKKIHHEITVTATRIEKETFEVPNPVSVVNTKELLEKAPNNVSDLFFELPGVDVNGVGVNQSRPIIRGLRGQRILLLEDGIRMNNSRRQQDFGEIPAIVDVSGINRVEVVRGPASVLYGSDAIGGVINIITNAPRHEADKKRISGNVGYRFDSAGSQHKGNTSLFGNWGDLRFMLSGTYRNAGEYNAPAGSFGDIELETSSPVHDTGVKDNSFTIFVGYRLYKDNDISLKYEYYNAENAGFGYVDPERYNPGSPLIRIQYPDQSTNKLTFNFRNRNFQSPIADGISFTGYYLNNQRRLSMNIFIPFGIPALPQAGIESTQKNNTTVNTSGLRLEMTKVLFKKHIITYGVDFHMDNSENTDVETTAIVGFGPFPPMTDNTPSLPFARYRSFGVFIQDDFPLLSQVSLILGLRYQDVSAKTKDTPGLEGLPLVNSSDRTFVGAANLIFRVNDNLRFVSTIGRGFRSPNLIERFFDGTTPEGSGYQIRNLNLKPETSFNLDFGFKYRNEFLYAESTYFFNTIYDGIRTAWTGNMVFGIREYQNVNIDRLRMQGVEALTSIRFGSGVSLTANFTNFKSKDLSRPEVPYSDTYSSKLNVALRYDDPRDRFWAEYHLRFNGDQKHVELIDNPIGSIIPGFVVNNIRAGITLFPKGPFPQKIGVIVGNLFNTLYSEFSNSSFFRPAPGRHIIFSWNVNF